MEDIQAVIVEYLRDELRIEERELTTDAQLVRSGLLDSVGLVQLAGYLERAFDIEIPDQDIDAERMDSVGMIVQYVASSVASRAKSG